MDSPARRLRRCAEADRRRSANGLAARFRRALRRPTGRSAARTRMSQPKLLPRETDYGIEYLQRRLDREFPLARHIGGRADSADDRRVVLRAPFAPNANYKGTAFGGRLFSLAVLAGWGGGGRPLAAAPPPPR